MSFDEKLQRRWYGDPGWLRLLWPLEILYRAITALRRNCYRFGLFAVWRAPVPVVVVGNISVGGTGKTPVTIALCSALQQAGFTPGIVSRGYRAAPPQFPFAVTPTSAIAASGDEPLLLARRTGCPVVIAPRRALAAQHLLQTYPQCDVIICDDGLQHYALARDIELAVVDGVRGFGNGHCLPVGPLRETRRRLRSVDAVLINSEVQRAPEQSHYWFQVRASAIVNIASGRAVNVVQWFAEHPRVHAVAGIGNPQRFFATLQPFGSEIDAHTFPDHHDFVATDFQFGDALPVLMTEKDAVKCAAFAAEHYWFLRVDAELPDSLCTQIVGKLRSIR